MKRVIRVLKRDLHDPMCDRSNPFDCPIVRAIKRVVKTDVSVSCDSQGYRVGAGDYVFKNRAGHRVFATRGTKTKPFTFTVDLPANVLKRRRAKKT